MSTIRLFNTHPTQGFWGQYQSKAVIHQPEKGEWALKREKVPNPKSPRKYSWSTQLVCINPEKVCQNWIDVPEDYAQLCLKGNMSGKTADDEISATRHGGFIKSQLAVDAIMQSQYAQRKKELEAIEAQIAAKEKDLAAVKVAIATEGSKPREKPKAEERKV